MMSFSFNFRQVLDTFLSDLCRPEGDYLSPSSAKYLLIFGTYRYVYIKTFYLGYEGLHVAGNDDAERALDKE